MVSRQIFSRSASDLLYFSLYICLTGSDTIHSSFIISVNIKSAAQKMARLKDEVFMPCPEHRQVYDQLYADYLRLHDYFGRGENDVMKRLKHIKASTRK